MSYYPQYFAVIAQITKQHFRFGSVLPPKESHITPRLGTTAVDDPQWILMEKTRLSISS